MRRDELATLLHPLALRCGGPFPQPVISKYYRAVQHLSSDVVTTAIDSAVRMDPRYVPSPSELRDMAERHRKALQTAVPYDGCAECEGQKGYRTIISERGVRTVEPCPCRERYKLKLARLGAGNEPLALLEAESVEA